MKRRLFLKQLGLAASLPWLGRAALATAEAAPKAAGTCKILSCNIRVNLPQDEKNGFGWSVRKDVCADVIRDHKADVVCLQECQQLHWADLKRRLPGYDTYGLANPGEAFNPGNAIFYLKARWEVISAGGFWLSEKPHVAGSQSWDSAHARFANWVELRERASGRALRVWNTHLDHIGQTAREKQAQLVVEASQALPKELPQVLAGDMNAPAANQAITNLREGGWIDTYETLQGDKDPGNTFHGFLGPKYAERHPDKPMQRIDWIFIRGPLQPLAAAVLRDERRGRYPSDHYFMSATVAWR